MITMALGGLWHGAAWTFVLWGVYQGVVLVIGRTLSAWTSPRRRSLPAGLSWQRIALGVLMFHVTCYGWLIFRADSAAQVAEFSRLLLTSLTPSATTLRSLVVPFVQVAAPLLVVHIYQARHGSESAPLALPLVPRYALYGAVGYLTLLFGDFAGAQFIYFQF
jgi:D-alanyl-lipoteichoic acid acyltransferase DltB (MBOAT superfamily)